MPDYCAFMQMCVNENATDRANWDMKSPFFPDDALLYPFTLHGQKQYYDTSEFAQYGIMQLPEAS